MASAGAEAAWNPTALRSWYIAHACRWRQGSYKCPVCTRGCPPDSWSPKSSLAREALVSPPRCSAITSSLSEGAHATSSLSMYLQSHVQPFMGQLGNGQKRQGLVQDTRGGQSPEEKGSFQPPRSGLNPPMRFALGMRASKS